jgi:hypothetical protein
MAAPPELDFCSAHFDPSRALATERLQPPVPSARPLDNLHQCRRLLPPDHPDHLPPLAPPGAAPPPPSAKVSKVVLCARWGAMFLLPL